MTNIFNQEIIEEEELALPFFLHRNNSGDSLLGAFINRTNSADRPSFFPQQDVRLVLSFEEVEWEENKKQVNVFKKQRKVVRGKGSKADYRKNICGYITKKIIREFINHHFDDKIQTLCQKYGADFDLCKRFYQGRIEGVTGPSHIPFLLKPQNQAEIGPKRVFAQFFQWFLRERYMRCLLLEGKMQNKPAYIRYKNEALLQTVRLMSQEPSSFEQ